MDQLLQCSLKLLVILKLPLLLFGLFIGFLFARKPELAIELQRRFYEKINWKIEPISMSKEIRNTRFMGISLIIFCIIAIIILFFMGNCPLYYACKAL